MGGRGRRSALGRRAPGRRLLLLASALLASAVAPGCGGGDGSSARTTRPLVEGSTTSTTAGPTSTTMTVPDFGYDHELVQQVWRDYEAAIDAIEAAVQEPADDASLGEHLTGALLSQWRARLASYVERGERVVYPATRRGREVLESVVVRSPVRVDLVVCSLDDSVLVDSSTSSTINDRVVVLRSTESLLLERGTWRLGGRDGTEVEEASCFGG